MRGLVLICGVVVCASALAGLALAGHAGGPRAVAQPASVAHPLRQELGREPQRAVPKPRPKPEPKPHLLPFDWPAKGTITGVYGDDGGRRHPGIDIGILRSLRVRAAAPGRVIAAGYTTGYDGYGKVVVVRTGKLKVLYGHLSRVAVRRGELVKRDERLGTAGCTGWCTGTHLHFEVRNKQDRTLNPMRMLASTKRR